MGSGSDTTPQERSAEHGLRASLRVEVLGSVQASGAARRVAVPGVYATWWYGSGECQQRVEVAGHEEIDTPCVGAGSFSGATKPIPTGSALVAVSSDRPSVTQSVSRQHNASGKATATWHSTRAPVAWARTAVSGPAWRQAFPAGVRAQQCGLRKAQLRSGEPSHLPVHLPSQHPINLGVDRVGRRVAAQASQDVRQDVAADGPASLHRAPAQVR